ncbi:MAG: hypothetical protein AAF517_02025 [Planctomycetota bacterium]
MQRARAFLLKTQGEDGVWETPSTLKRKKREAIETSNYFGTGWAVLGLLETLPRRIRLESP